MDDVPRFPHFTKCKVRRREGRRGLSSQTPGCSVYITYLRAWRFKIGPPQTLLRLVNTMVGTEWSLIWNIIETNLFNISSAPFNIFIDLIYIRNVPRGPFDVFKNTKGNYAGEKTDSTR